MTKYSILNIELATKEPYTLDSKEAYTERYKAGRDKSFPAFLFYGGFKMSDSDKQISYDGNYYKAICRDLSVDIPSYLDEIKTSWKNKATDIASVLLFLDEEGKKKIAFILSLSSDSKNEADAVLKIPLMKRRCPYCDSKCYKTFVDKYIDFSPQMNKETMIGTRRLAFCCNKNSKNYGQSFLIENLYNNALLVDSLVTRRCFSCNLQDTLETFAVIHSDHPAEDLMDELISTIRGTHLEGEFFKEEEVDGKKQMILRDRFVKIATFCKECGIRMDYGTLLDSPLCHTFGIPKDACNNLPPGDVATIKIEGAQKIKEWQIFKSRIKNSELAFNVRPYPVHRENTDFKDIVPIILENQEIPWRLIDSSKLEF